jgi:hypothetical protein
MESLEEITEHFADQPGPETEPRRAPRSEVETSFRQEPVQDGSDRQEADDRGIGRGVEDSPPDDSYEGGDRHRRPVRQEWIWVGE